MLLLLLGSVSSSLSPAGLAWADEPREAPLGSRIGVPPSPDGFPIQSPVAQVDRVRFTRETMAHAAAGESPSWTQSSDNALLARICDNLDRAAVPPIEFMTLRPARDATDELRRRVGRAAKAAFKGLLLDAADPEQRFDPHEDRSFPASSPSTFGSGGDRVRLRLGVSNTAPTVKMHYSLGGGTLGLSISALGQVSLGFHHARFARSWLHAGYSRTRGTCELLWRSSF